MSITRPVSLTKENLDEIVKAFESRGGSIVMQDPRVSQVQVWMWGALGAGFLVLGGWLINSVNELNRTMERVVTTNEYIAKMIDDHAERIKQLEQHK